MSQQCVEAFEQGNKQDAEQLLPQIGQPAHIRRSKTHFEPGRRWYAGQVSLLHLAAANGWVDIVIELITKYKCDTNYKDSQGNTPLHYATVNSHLAVVKYFINKQHCDPMARDNNDVTPVHYACSNGHLNIAEYLIREAHCNPSCENNDGETPLHYAFRYRHLNIAEYLISEENCNPSCKDKKGSTPLHLACRNGHLNITDYLISEADCNPSCENSDGETPLHYACCYGNFNIAKYLISEAYCNPSCENNDGETPLHYTCRYGHFNIAKHLISEAHCNPSCENKKGSTSLHYACGNGHPNLGQYLVREEQCNPSCEDGETPLHYACRYGHFNIAKYLISEANCNPSCENKKGSTPLHLACRYGHFDIAKYLISEENCNPSCENKKGSTSLHYACGNGHFNIAQYLMREAHCSPSCENKNGDTPLHYACRNDHLNIPWSKLHFNCHNGHLKIAWYLISEANCNPSCKNKYGDTPLHLACEYSHTDIVHYLLSTGKVDILAKNKNGNTPVYKLKTKLMSPLHLAAHHGWMDIVIDLITKHKCDTNSDKDSEGQVPLHYACHYGYLNIAQYLIREAHCNPSCENNYSETPLHLACRSGHTHIVQYLLSTGRVDPLAKTNYDETAIDIASRHYDNYNLHKLFQSFPQCKRDFPVHTYTKLILTGYSGAGKTTISQLILLLASKQETGFFSALSSGRVTEVECLTAGIIPLHVESKEVGNMVVYDFAGQQEYYSSHAAVLERIMRNSAAIFVCIIDLSQCMDKISESIHYWISFIENNCSSAQGSSHVIIVGSHADQVKSPRELKKKSSLVESIAKSRVKQLTYGGFVSMDCRMSKTKESRNFRSLLSTRQQALLSSQPSMSWYCHVLYAYLHTKLGKTGCTLQELSSALTSEEDSSPESTLLTESLTSLSDKGLILFLQNQEHPQSSWVVVEKDDLLREVNGTLFAPDNFKQYRQVASNTGIVPIATLEELFPQYSSEMLVGCLESMEFCHQVDPSTLQATNLKATSSSPSSGANHLFFPSLVKEHRPGDLPSPKFGWCLGCSDPHQFFGNRFLHVLLLQLAFKFPLASKDRSLSPPLRGLERQCKVWQNGICWKSVSGVFIIVEIIDLNRWVIVLVSEKTREAAEIYSSVIRIILDLQHQLCSAVVTTCECLISPSLLDRYPFDALPDNDLFDLPTVARSMLLHHKLLLDQKEGTNEFSTDEALSCEPYYLLQPSSVCQLFNQSMASQPVPDPLLQEVLRYCQQPHQKPRDHKELRECVNKHSIFAGRNPLVSSVQAVL